MPATGIQYANLHLRALGSVALPAVGPLDLLHQFLSRLADLVFAGRLEPWQSVRQSVGGCQAGLEDSQQLR